jgi:hypothetical protein
VSRWGADHRTCRAGPREHGRQAARSKRDRLGGHTSQTQTNHSAPPQAAHLNLFKDVFRSTASCEGGTAGILSGGRTYVNGVSRAEDRAVGHPFRTAVR